MPIYEYECKKCHHVFERIQKFSDPPLKKCPECRTGRLEKLLSPPAVHFKGTGWYVTDYARKGGAGGPDKDKDKDKESKSGKESDTKAATADSSSKSKSTTKDKKS